jgi:hypothetical protein
MNLHLELDPNTAIGVAEYFERNGATAAADKLWMEITAVTGYDRRARERLGDIIFDSRHSGFPYGTVERSRFILSVMALSFPTTKLVAAYFENLERLLQGRPKRTRPGDVVLGIGSGRCGSTTLSAAFAGLPDACATHENPPRINWDPINEQVQFHMDRLRRLADYFPLVFDAAHSWFRVMDRFFAEFPNGKVIGLARDTQPCVQSYLKFQGRGRGSANHWAPHDNGIWIAQAWDAVYPSYPVPPGLVPGTEAAYATKAAMIAQYVTEYNQALTALAEAEPHRVALIRTEAMNDPATAQRIAALVNQPLVMPQVALNVGTNADGAQHTFWF